MKCRFCSTPVSEVFLDLGTAPPSNAFLSAAALAAPEVFYPLRLFTCTSCYLVQVEYVQSHTALFAPDYAYYSSYSRSWLKHAQHFVDDAVTRLGLGPRSLVVEIASNDGYLLQYVAAKGIPCLGIEPTDGTAQVARDKGIETIGEFFGRDFATGLVSGRGYADLIVANNVLAHVPDLNDFVAGIAIALSPEGSLSVEFPHLKELIDHNQFDTVYHEHFSYFSFGTVQAVLATHGLKIWDVERLPTHGGSLRVWASHRDNARKEEASVSALLVEEELAGMRQPAYYQGFQAKANAVKDNLLEFLLAQRKAGRKVAGYGAAAKGNTLLNYAGIKPDLLQYVVDASPHKQGLFLPGSRIPVVAEGYLSFDQPDVVVILPWNLKQEIVQQLSYISEWNGTFVTAVPEMEVRRA